MTQPACLAPVRALVAELWGPVPDDGPLDLDSLTVVMLIEAIEDQFDLRFDAGDVVPEHFETILALADFVQRKRS